MKKENLVNIVGRVDDQTGIGRMALSFLEAYAGAYNVNFVDTRPGVSKLNVVPAGINIEKPFKKCLNDAKISIFTDVTWNGKEDNNWEKTPSTNVKTICSIFDSTSIPRKWVEIINNNFCAVFVASKCLINVYKNSGVQKPIFYLPISLDLAPFLNMHRPALSNNRPFTFGFIGSREVRKNIDKLVDAFCSAFHQGLDVRLFLHMGLDFGGDSAFFDKIMMRDDRIVISTGLKNRHEYLGLFSEIDCFVSLSRGEGFSIVPREFLAAGKPVILSDCSAHSEVLYDLETIGSQLCFAVESDIPVPAQYFHIDGGGIYGLQYDPYLPSAVNTLRSVYERREQLFTDSLIAGRRLYASRFDRKSLAPLYRSIIEPKFIRKNIDNLLEGGGIFTNDSVLISRLTGAPQVDETHRVTKTQRPEKLVVIGNDAGFFGVFNRYVSYLVWTLEANPMSVVLPDWRIDAMQQYWNVKSFTSFCYGRPEDGNIWLKLFEVSPFRGITEDTYNDESLLYDKAILKDDFNEENEPWLTYIHAYKLYKSTDFQRWRLWYHLYFNAFVRLRPRLQKIIDDYARDSMSGFKIISAHVRHPSHAMEQPGGRMPTVELFCIKTRELMARDGLDKHSARIFVATDQDTVISQFKEEFGDLVIFSSDATRITKDHDTKYNTLSKTEKLKEGHQIQHIMASDPSNWNTKMAEEVLVDAYLLARGDYFVHVTSNIATAVSFINPYIEMIYCE